MLNKFYFILLLLCFAGVDTLVAKVSLPAVFQSHMVLQQKEKIAIWGWATANAEVNITPGWSNAVKVKVNAEGMWRASLTTLKAGGPYSLKIADKESSIELNDLLFGEVWLCSGQSNMNFPLQKGASWRSGVINYQEVVAQANYPNIRFFTVEQQVAETPRNDCKGNWEVCTPSTAGNFSAVAYYFALEIQKYLGVPLGIIHSSWGGTPVEAWTKREVLESDADFLPILERYKKHNADPLKAQEEFKQANEEWKKSLHEGKLKGIDAVQGPKEPLLKSSNKSPSNLYNAMIAPLIPFTVKGVLWYQGESNAERAYQYRKLFPAMIDSWRKDWDKQFPFYFVQIAPHKSQPAEIREAQLLAYKSVPKTGMAVITDAGDSSDIHPRNKEIVGKRLSLWALAETYNKKVDFSGPIYKAMEIKDGKAILSFEFSKGLHASSGVLKEFVIAGGDQTFYPAKAEIKGNKVVVWSDKVASPKAVRFGWKYVPHAELYNGAQLPASPFRTDNWPGETENNR